MTQELLLNWQYIQWSCAAGSRLPAPSLWPLLDMHPAPTMAPVTQPALPSIPEQTQPAAQQQTSTGTDPSLARLEALNAAAASALMLQLGHEGCGAFPQDASHTAHAGSPGIGKDPSMTPVHHMILTSMLLTDPRPWPNHLLKAFWHPSCYKCGSWQGSELPNDHISDQHLAKPALPSFSSACTQV